MSFPSVCRVIDDHAFSWSVLLISPVEVLLCLQLALSMKLISPISAGLGLSATVAADAQPYSYAIFFGDSYTDDSRSSWWGGHGGTLPPAGTKPPEVDNTASGGWTYPQYIEQTLGSAITVGDYAFSGSGCSQSLVPLVNGAALADNMVPEFVSDVQAGLYPGISGDNTVYSIWIGTNDIGVNGFLLNKEVAGKTLHDAVECVWTAIDQIYNAGGRRFILMSQNILDYTPLYQTPAKGGSVTDYYWPDKNNYDYDQINQQMASEVATINQAYHDDLTSGGAQRWPGANLAIFDVHQLMLDLYNNPDEYFDAPANVTWYYNENGCSPNCNDGRSLDSYMWFDSLHPSNKTGKCSITRPVT